MTFWNNVKLNIHKLPIVPNFGNNNNENSQKQNKNQNIFNNLLNQVPKDTFERSHKRLNDLDSSILNKNLFRFLPDDSLRIELQLEKAEDEFKDTEKEIKAVKLLDLDENGDTLTQLEEKKQQINEKIQDYRSQYRELGLIYKIADIIAENYNKIQDKFNEKKIQFTGHPLFNKAKDAVTGFDKSEELNNVLEKFNALQPKIKKTFSNKVNPFGESESYFKDFTTLMDKINKLDFQTNKLINSTKQAKSRFFEEVKSSHIKIINFVNNLKDKYNKFFEE